MYMKIIIIFYLCKLKVNPSYEKIKRERGYAHTKPRVFGDELRRLKIEIKNFSSSADFIHLKSE